MSDDGFRLPDSSYDQLTKIVLAYGAFSVPAAPSEVGKAINIHETTISRNGGFLTGIGILEGARKKSLTQQGRDLARALEHEMPDQIRKMWREIVVGNDFIQKILTAVRIRKGMDRPALQSHIAYSAGQSKTELVMRGANCLIDILRAGELLKEEDGKLIAVTERAQRTSDSLEIHDATVAVEPNAKTERLVDSLPTVVVADQPAVTIQIQVHVQCTSDELEGLGPKLRRVMEELSSTSSPSNLETGNSDQTDDL